MSRKFILFLIFQVEILKQHPSNPEIYRVQVLGYEHKEVKKRSLLRESLGETVRKAQIEKVADKSVKNTTIAPPSVASVVNTGGNYIKVQLF